MAYSVVGIIFSNIHDRNIPELTRKRTMASVPFACRYRLIDFTLSNMVNSDITHIGVITHYNYQSLMDHLGTGKDWDLARSSGGITILPPYITAFANNINSLYTTRLEALMSINSFISNCKEEYVVLSDCDIICNIDLREIIEYHIQTGADATFAVKNTFIASNSEGMQVVIESENGIVTDIADSASSESGWKDVNLNIWVMKRSYLQDIILDSIAHGYRSFTKDVLKNSINRANLRVFKYNNRYFAGVESLTEYYKCSIDMLTSSVRNELFGSKNRPVFTKVRNSAPTKYCEGSSVRNSLIADGCIIEGNVENSIIFRGVKIGKNSTVRGCILMQGTLVGENATLNCVVTDKSVVILDGRNLAGHETKPFYIDKQSIV